MPLSPIEVEINSSRLKAFVTLRPQEGSSLPDSLALEQQVLAELEKQGVTFGLEREAIRTLIANRRWGDKVLVAKGVAPLHGEDGRVEYFFDIARRPRPRELESGKVDYREIGLIQIVKKDALLARLIPARDGIAGTTVTGQRIPARSGLEACILAGANTGFADPDRRELRAQVPGSVSMIRGIIHVERTLTAPGDVNFTSGNINFPGDVVIKGDVLSGFCVKAGGKVEIHGVVEDAMVEAGQDIMIKGGFEGSGHGFLRCGGSVHVKFIENQSVEAAGSVYIGDMALHANVISKESIHLTTGKGQVIGGHLKAHGGITAKILGNAQFSPTIVEIIPDDAPPHELLAREAALSNQQAKIVELLGAVKNLQQKKQIRSLKDPSGQALSPMADHLRTLGDSQLAELGKRLQTLRGEFMRSAQELQEFESKMKETQGAAKVIALQRVYPGTEIIIGEWRQVIKQECNRTVFEKPTDQICVPAG